MDKAGEIAPAVARMDRDHRALPPRCPHAPDDRLEAEATLVHRPGFYLRLRMRHVQRRYLALDLFL